MPWINPLTLQALNIFSFYINKYPARCKSVDKNMSINVIFTAENQKYMNIELYVNFVWRDNWCDTDGWKSNLLAHRKAYCKCTLYS